MRPIIEKGYLYASCPPKYKIVVDKNTTKYAFNEEERDKIISEYPNKKLQITYLKGLGEMNADQLWETTMNPENRTLIQVTCEDAEECEKYISLCMSDDSIARKEWILEYRNISEFNEDEEDN